jgi:hypothetical protein
MTWSKDLLSGLFFLAVGLFLVGVGRNYPLGTLLRMGPGYFPILVGALMALIGLALVVQSFLRPGEKASRPALKPLAQVTVSLFVFAVTLDRLGLVLATVILIVLSRLASPLGSWRGTAVLSVVMVATAVLIFHTVLDLPLKLWP